MTQVQHMPAAPARSPQSQSNQRAERALRLAYLTTEYPKVSHTFIRREILELEKRGHTIIRIAIRGNGGAVVDTNDVKESEKTFVCLSRPFHEFVAAVSWAVVTRPGRMFKALRTSLAMSRISDRGLVRHIAYLVEAALLTRMLIRQRVAHVHVHFGTNAAAVARLVRTLDGPRYSITVHGPDEFDAPRALCLGGKIADAEFAIAISHFCSAQLRRWTAVEHWNKIHVVHCTVADDYFDTARPIAPGAKTLVCVGRLSAQKGHLLLLEAAKQLARENIEFKIVLAGDGEMRSEIEARIDALGLRSHVEITGWIGEPEVRERMLNARAVVQPSFAEGLPVVLMEAMALCRPVITTAIAGIPELVEHEKNGWLIPAGNVEPLCDAMRSALRMPTTTLNAMGEAGCERVRDRHRTSSEVDKLEALLMNAAHSAGDS
jgi:colanic acid/amylovoran biosynthesis glycosyltransferase